MPSNDDYISLDDMNTAMKLVHNDRKLNNFKNNIGQNDDIEIDQ